MGIGVLPWSPLPALVITPTDQLACTSASHDSPLTHQTHASGGAENKLTFLSPAPKKARGWQG